MGERAGADRAGGLLVLAVNAGSSSLKLRLLDADDGVEASGDVPAPTARPTNRPSATS